MILTWIFYNGFLIDWWWWWWWWIASFFTQISFIKSILCLFLFVKFNPGIYVMTKNVCTGLAMIQLILIDFFFSPFFFSLADLTKCYKGINYILCRGKFIFRIYTHKNTHKHWLKKMLNKLSKQKLFLAILFNAFATGDFEKHIELQQINDAYMRRW